MDDAAPLLFSMNATGSQALSVAVALRQALAHHRAGRLQEAEQLYRAILQAQPFQPDANHNLGLLAAQVGQPAAGLPYLKTALTVDPSKGQYALAYADALLATGQAGDALTIIRNAMQRGLNTPAAQALRQKAEAAALSDSAKGAVPTPAAINQLAALFNAGRYAEMESQARLLVEQYPESGLAWNILATSLQTQAKDALPTMQKAAELLPDDAGVHNNLGNALKPLGRLNDAVKSYRRALQIKPDYATAHYNLGDTLQLLGQLDDAAASYRRALEIRPDDADAHFNLGVTLKDLGQVDGAVASYRRALEIRPDFAEAHYNLGVGLQELEQIDAAMASYRRALQIKPDYAEAHYNLGIALQHLGQIDASAASYHRALEIKPDYAEAHNNLGNVLKDLGQFDGAMASYRRALEIQPDFAEAHYNLGVALQYCGLIDAAVASYSRALEIKPDYADAHNNLGIALQDRGQLDDAVASYRRALEIKPDFAEAHTNLGSALMDLGQIDDAVASHRRALELKPDYEDAFGSLLFALNYHPDKSAQEIFAAYREYDERFGLPLRSTWRDYPNSRETRRLRVGYVSPDFRQHSARNVLEPLLAHHDKRVVEVYAYAELSREDAVTARYRGYLDQWIPTVGLSDEALAERIRADRIDVLVDLAGHTAHNRLQVFARKPAPVSVSWMGYGYTTGLTAVDYMLTDEACAPAGSEELFSETLWRVPTPVYAYRPAEGMGAVSALPAAERGHVTFGTLTRAVRINHRTIRVWSQILKRVDGARLVVDSKNFRDASMQAALAEKFAAHGIDRERLEIGFHSPPWDVLRGLDIGLDCFPHNSGTTLFESLYLGVPYVSLAHRPSVGRLGSSILQGAGHPEWIARTEDEYVEKAVALASDLPKLAVLRAGLRAQLESSPLMDEAGFARKVEAAYWGCWRDKWGNTQPGCSI